MVTTLGRRSETSMLPKDHRKQSLRLRCWSTNPGAAPASFFCGAALSALPHGSALTGGSINTDGGYGSRYLESVLCTGILYTSFHHAALQNLQITTLLSIVVAMPIKSRWSLEAHHVSIPTFIFGSCSEPLDTSTKIFLDAKRPSTHYFTLESFREWSKRFAEGLTVAGLEQGDRVTLFSGNNIFTPVVVMGVIMAGGTYSSANPAYTPRELANQLRDSKPRFVLAADNCVDRALQATNIIGMPAASIFFFEDLPIQTVMNKPLVQPATTRCKHWATLLGTEEKSARFTWEELNTPELSAHTAVMVYSSGTTGLPKGVELTHFTLVSNMRQLMKVQLSDASIRERRGLCCLPMYHGLGLVYYVFIAPKARMQVVMMDRWHLASVLRCIEKYRITELVLVPPMVASIGADAGARSGQYDLSSVRKVLAGAAPLGLETTRQFEKLWGRRLKIRQAWGMSE